MFLHIVLLYTCVCPPLAVIAVKLSEGMVVSSIINSDIPKVSKNHIGETLKWLMEVAFTDSGSSRKKKVNWRWYIDSSVDSRQYIVFKEKVQVMVIIPPTISIQSLSILYLYTPIYIDSNEY